MPPRFAVPLPAPMRLAHVLTLAFALLLSGLVSPAAAGPGALVVRDDRGGAVLTRAVEIRDLRRSHRDVRIVGSICYSSCTMLLGLPGACVSPQTVFGFHGPSRSGAALDPMRFEQASRLIAMHYPPVLRRWYMETARYKIDGLRKLRGADLIRIGVRAC